MIVKTTHGFIDPYKTFLQTAQALMRSSNHTVHTMITTEVIRQAINTELGYEFMTRDDVRIVTHNIKLAAANRRQTQ